MPDDQFYDQLNTPPAKPQADIELPAGDDIAELAKSAIPALVRKAIIMAHGSDKLGEVLGLLRELADRAYGKPMTSTKLIGDAENPIESKVHYHFQIEHVGVDVAKKRIAEDT